MVNELNAAEIVAVSGSAVFSTSGTSFSLYNALTGAYVESIDTGYALTSIDIFGNILVAAAYGGNKWDAPGKILFYDVANISAISKVHTEEVGYLPDMVTYSPDGNMVLVACEGEPSDDYNIDPEGSVWILDVSGATVTSKTKLGFGDYTTAELLAKGIRIFGKNATVAQDMEPEFIAVSPDSTRAMVACQENNAMVVVDLTMKKIVDIFSAGTQDWSITAIDPSDKDGEFNPTKKAKVKSFNMPDAITSFTVNGKVYYAAANEGDARDYDGFSEEERVDDLILDGSVYPSDFANEENWGRLKVTTVNSTSTQIWGYGGRSITIWKDTGEMVTEMHVTPVYKQHIPDRYQDKRSDDKGPEPEGILSGVINGVPYIFACMERTSDIFVYDMSIPKKPLLVQIIWVDGLESPEGLFFQSADKSPNGKPMLYAAYEESGHLAAFEMIDLPGCTPSLKKDSTEATLDCGDLKFSYRYAGCCHEDPTKMATLLAD
eukprot:CAMPEP_0119335102 /NCGR_PEP_ID=MMETSP1333-20130426/88700_1 /TAXON_ID=418940 /ORGANISM="Scyphosphaera apsteinii, Strain RCC1455" /LENGTH=489 /DNA_ID=CAMNT_0007345565 /DNA_START=148 /DNA_END=1618 /DNA_ORIENTATION=-